MSLIKEFYANQKKTFEINPRHPVIKELLRRVTDDQEDPKALTTAKLLFETATLRSGFALKDQLGFAERIEQVNFWHFFILILCRLQRVISSFCSSMSLGSYADLEAENF